MTNERVGTPPTVSEKPLCLTLYSRTYCHLCDDMAVAVKALGSESGRAITLTIVDVDADPELENHFGDLVPVLMHGDAEVCHYFLDSAKLLEILKI